MAGNKIICTKHEVSYLDIRMAMCEGVRTVEELIEKTGVCNTCEGCKENLEWILSSVCGCKKTSLQAVVEAVHSGADTVEKVGEMTGAGTACGRCKKLIANIIELGR